MAIPKGADPAHLNRMSPLQVLRTSCLRGAMHIPTPRRLKTESSFYLIHAFGGFKKLAFS